MRKNIFAECADITIRADPKDRTKAIVQLTWKPDGWQRFVEACLGDMGIVPDDPAVKEAMTRILEAT